MENVQITKNPRINSLTGIKFFAVFLIFYQHSSLPEIPMGLGSRMCELLFVISGFLVGYNSIGKEIPCTWKESFLRFYKKIIQFWPIYCIVTLLNFLIRVKSFLGITSIVKLVISLLLLQSWSSNPDVYFAYNGSAWFFASIMFCYFVSPLAIKIMKQSKSWILLLLIILVRFFCTFIRCNYPINFLSYEVHVFPIIRFSEFFMGMLMIPSFCKTKELINKIGFKKRYFLFSLLEISIFIISICCMLVFLGKWYIIAYVILFSLFVFIFAFDEGVLSKIFGNKLFQKLSIIQFEFYISHTTFLLYSNVLLNHFGIKSNTVIFSVISNILIFILLIIICFIYSKFFKTFFSNLLNKFLHFFINRIRRNQNK